MPWRWAAASVIGSSHIHTNDRLQDAYAVRSMGDEHIFAIVCDGAGSARYGAFGAWLACRMLTTQFRDWVRDNPTPPDAERISGWINCIRERIAAIAEDRGSTPRQFATTLAALFVSPDDLLTIQIGDSAVAARSAGEWEAICWPETGEYASTTYFLTDDPEPRLTICHTPQNYSAFALFSDGVGDLALSHIEQTAHQRFFEPMIKPVDAADGEGRLPDLSNKLGQYLAGPSVCERTDDDKTLILISRN